MFFENHNFKGQAGMSLVEVLIAAAIGALVMTLSTNFFLSFNDQKKAQETKANARMQREIVTNFLRAKVPVSIAALSVTAPTAAVWSCPSAGPCTFQTNTTDGIKIDVSCDSVANIPILDRTPFDIASASLSAGCVKCPARTRPMMTMRVYSGGALIKTQRLPDPNATNKLIDLLGMGICFSAPLYQENTGTAAAPVMVNRWNRWNITIIPYFFTRSPNGNDTAHQLLSKLMMSPEQLTLAPDSQLGPSMRIMNSSVAPSAGP